MPLDPILPPILTSWAPFLALRIHFEIPVGPDWARNTRNLKKPLFWAPFSTTFGPQRRPKMTHVLNLFCLPSPDRFSRASGLHFESFWPSILILFGTRGEKWKQCYRYRVNPPERVREGHIYDLFAVPFRGVLWKQILTPHDLNLHEFGIPLASLFASFWDTF